MEDIAPIIERLGDPAAKLLSTLYLLETALRQNDANVFVKTLDLQLQKEIKLPDFIQGRYLSDDVFGLANEIGNMGFAAMVKAAYSDQAVQAQHTAIHEAYLDALYRISFMLVVGTVYREKLKEEFAVIQDKDEVMGEILAALYEHVKGNWPVFLEVVEDRLVEANMLSHESVLMHLLGQKPYQPNMVN